MSVHRLVYHSVNRITGTPEAVLGTVEQILAVSRRNNQKVGVTER